MRWSRGTVPILPVVVGVLLAAGAAAVPFTDRPQFCASCHTIRPSVDSWEASSHKDVTCVECHVRPGLAGFIEDKVLKGMRDVAVTWFGTPTDPHDLRARVDSDVCAGCHRAILRVSEVSTRDLPAPVNDVGLVMSHRKHMEAFAQRGRGEGCTTCHARVVHGTPVKGYPIVIPRGHVTLDTKPHYPDHPEGSALWNAALADCARCHDDTTAFAGTALRSECDVCHLKNKLGDFLF